MVGTSLTNDSAKPPGENRGGSRNEILIPALVIALALGAYFVIFRSPTPRPMQKQSQLPFGTAEKSYAAKLQVGNFAMSQAENFLNQNVKILAGDVVNTGDKTLLAIDGTIEFNDTLDQLTLRDTRPLLIPPAAPLEPGKTAHFEISFDHVPTDWNYQLPTVRITGLRFAPDKN
jgi:hypothetical protein